MTDIRTRISLIFAALGALCAVIAVLALDSLKDANEQAERSYREIALPYQYLSDAYKNVLTVALLMQEASKLGDGIASKPQLEFIDKLVPVIRKDMELFNRSRKPERADSVASAFASDIDKTLTALLESAQLARTGDMVSSMSTMMKARPYGLAAGQEMGELTTLLNSAADTAHEQAARSYVHMRDWVLGALVLGGIACGLAAWWQMRVLDRSLSSIQESLHYTSGSLDLTKRANFSRNDEIGRTASAFNHLIERVGSAISDVRHATGTVHTAAVEIASGNEDLSARTEEQASSLEETAASMAQLTETVKQNADNARQASTLAAHAMEMAGAGNDAVQNMVGTIDKINSSSTKVSEITGVIEGIAFQTNILALNAAVEAARAGDHGRGFAVVASEVRNLAQRSAGAAKEIKDLIGSSVTMVQNGAKQASEVGSTIGAVKQAIRQVSDLVGEIAAASEEQSRGIEQVSRAVMQMDEVTQHNAALVEQSAAAAHSLEEQARSLKAAVSKFQITDTSLTLAPIGEQF